MYCLSSGSAIELDIVSLIEYYTLLNASLVDNLNAPEDFDMLTLSIGEFIPLIANTIKKKRLLRRHFLYSLGFPLCIKKGCGYLSFYFHQFE